MRAKRTIALLASPLIAAAALTISPAALSQASDVSVVSAPPAPTPKPTKTRTAFEQGKKDGAAAGAQDGNDCNYRKSFAPKQSNSKYKAGYTSAYEAAYDKTCDEDDG
ncbi:hypothetical protein [Streptomyces mirabilis]